MPKAIRYDQPGGPDVMKWVDVEVGEPQAGQVRIKQHAVGLNYIDVYFRTGLYPQPLPGGLGMEAAGEVTAVGEGVTAFKPGDRVAYVSPPPGAYAQERVMPADRVVELPDAIGYDDAASVMLQGLTAHYLLRRTYPVKAGETILIHAAAGGVGLLVCQWAKALGATVIGTVGSDEKAELAKAHGCDHAIVYTRENFTQRVKEITNGAGVPVVYDSIGQDTYIGSLDCLAPLGLFVSFGSASGPLPPIDSKEFSSRGSLFFTRPTLFSYIAKRADLEAAAADLFDVILSGKVKASINQRYPLAEVARAHADLEARKTTGSTILVP